MLGQFTTEQLQAEIDRRSNPAWFIPELVAEGHDLDTDEFREATDWMEDNYRRGEDGTYY